MRELDDITGRIVATCSLRVPAPPREPSARDDLLVLEDVVNCGDYPDAFRDLAPFRDSRRFVPGKNLEYPLIGLADPAERAVRVAGKLVGRFSGMRRCFSD